MISRAGHISLIFFIITFLTGIDLKSQLPPPAYNFKHLNVQNGLSQNIVYHFLMDSRGYMWIGTHHGLNLYDGVKTTNFLHNEQDSGSLSGNFITAILEDSAQQIWIGNENGINRYNRKDHSFSHFAVDRPGGKKDTTYCVPLGFVTSDELWFLDTKTKSIRVLNTRSKNTSFIVDLNANNAVLYKMPGSGKVHLWSTYGKGTIHQVFINSKLKDQHTFFANNGSLHTGGLDISHVFQQDDTTAWLSTNEGLIKLDPEKKQYKIFNKWGKETVKEIRYAIISPNGQLWLGSGPSGVYTFDTKSSQFVNNFRLDKTDPLSICSNNIVSLHYDKMGNIWCGSYGNGISYANTENIFFSKHISKKEIQPFENDNKIAWIGFDRHKDLWCLFTDTRGLWLLDKDFKIIDRKLPLLKNGEAFKDYTTRLLFEPNDDKVWYATNKGLFIYDIHTNRLSPVKYQLLSEELMGSRWVNDIIRLNDNSLLFSTFAGLYHITKDTSQFSIRPVSVLNHEEFPGFRSLFQDEENNVYVKSMADFLYVIKPGGPTGNFNLVKRIRFSPRVNHFFHDKAENLIYLATSDGLYSISSKNFQIEKKPIGNNPLLSTNINSVLKTDNQFWLFGEKGIYFFDEKSNASRIFTTEDGLPANGFSPAAMIYNRGGRCLAGSANGLVSFFPHRKQHSFYPPNPQLRRIYIDDIADSSAKNPDELKEMNLAYRRNTFAFDFAPIAYYHADNCSFEYKLEGYDEDWVKSGQAHYTRYSKIPPGNYVFHLRALDAAGNISPLVKTIEINVARAFWQTPIFKMTVGAFLLFIGWLLSRWYFRYQIGKQKREFEKQQVIERERTRIATDMHDDLGAGLSRIKFISQSISNKKPLDDAIKTELEKITIYSDEMSEKMGEIVWALNEKNDTLADLIAYTRSYAIEYLAHHNITCKADTPLGLPGTFIPGEIRRNIFLSAKECLHNIVKHSGATCVNFSVELGHTIKITIHDNGKGIDWNNKRAFSNGLQNIQQRMEDVKGEVNFGNEQGTKVLLTIPL